MIMSQHLAWCGHAISTFMIYVGVIELPRRRRTIFEKKILPYTLRGFCTLTFVSSVKIYLPIAHICGLSYASILLCYVLISLYYDVLTEDIVRRINVVRA